MSWTWLAFLMNGRESDDREKDYSKTGSFSIVEFKRLAPMMERRGIRFRLEFDDSGIRNLVPNPSVNLASTGGLGAKVVVYVHGDDLREFERLVGKVLGR